MAERVNLGRRPESKEDGSTSREVHLPDGRVKRYRVVDANAHPAFEAGNPRFARTGFGEPPGGNILSLRR